MDLEGAAVNETPLTKEFLETILKREIVDFKISSGSKPGDNYTSILISLEVTLECEEKPLHLLFKTFPQHPTRQKLLEESNMFLKEFEIYDIWLPELIKFQKNVVGNNDQLLVPAMPELVAGAAIDYGKGNPNHWKDLDPMLSNYLLMVDVRKTYGYEMATRLESLGYHHVKVVLEELAKFHALGHAYKTHNKLTHLAQKFPCLEDTVYSNPAQKATLEAFFKMYTQLVLDTCKDFLSDRPEIAESLNKFKNDDGELAARYLATFMGPNGLDEEEVEGYMRTKKFPGSPIPDQWIVPIHGDCWTNNLLFRKDGSEDTVKSVVLVDLQLACETCLTSDIVYFLYTSTDTQFRKQYMDEMLVWYYERFVNFCNILKTPPLSGFSLINFQRKFHRSKMFGLLFAILGLPLILQRPETCVNLETVEISKGKEETGNSGEEFAELFQVRGSDEADVQLLRDRLTALLAELYDEGVL